MSERLQGARAELMRLVTRYVNPGRLAVQADERIRAAVEEIEAAAIEAHLLLTSTEGPAELMIQPAPAPVATVDPSVDVAEADHPGDSQPHV